MLAKSEDHANKLALRGALCRHHGLSIDIHRDAGICVTKEFLDYFDIFSVVLEKGCVAVPECMPADSFADTGFLDGRFPYRLQRDSGHRGWRPFIRCEANTQSVGPR